MTHAFKMCVALFSGGAVHTDTRASGHSLQWTKALISKPAPHWEGTAVINGEMKELKLTDYKVRINSFFSSGLNV